MRKNKAPKQPISLVDLAVVASLSAAAYYCKMFASDESEDLDSETFRETIRVYEYSKIMVDACVAAMRILYKRGLLTPGDKEWKYLQDRGLIPQDAGRAAHDRRDS